MIRRYDAALAKQGTNALDSVLLNLAEGNGRFGGDRDRNRSRRRYRGAEKTNGPEW